MKRTPCSRRTLPACGDPAIGRLSELDDIVQPRAERQSFQALYSRPSENLQARRIGVHVDFLLAPTASFVRRICRKDRRLNGCRDADQCRDPRRLAGRKTLGFRRLMRDRHLHLVLPRRRQVPQCRRPTRRQACGWNLLRCSLPIAERAWKRRGYRECDSERSQHTRRARKQHESARSQPRRVQRRGELASENFN